MLVAPPVWKQYRIPKQLKAERTSNKSQGLRVLGFVEATCSSTLNCSTVAAFWSGVLPETWTGRLVTPALDNIMILVRMKYVQYHLACPEGMDPIEGL